VASNEVGSRDVDGKGVVTGAVAELVAGLASDLALDLALDLTAEFEFRSRELRLGLELAPLFGAGLGLNLESIFAPDVVPDFVPDFAPDSESDFAVVSPAAD
jgi:hypothetical protein